MSFYVYRIFNKENILIYIGKTNDLFRRLSEHLDKQSWRNEVSLIEYTRLKTKGDMDMVESFFIKKDKPLYNKVMITPDIITLPNFETIQFKKLENIDIYSSHNEVFQENLIIKSNQFINSLYILDDISMRVLELVLSRIESLQDYHKESYVNIKDFRKIFNYTGGDTYDSIYKKVNNPEKFIVKSLDDESINMRIFENIEASNGVIEYKFSEKFFNLNTDFSQGFVAFELDSLVEIKNWKVKRFYELLESKRQLNKWKIDLEPLQKLLDNDYDNYGDFNRHVINKYLANIKKNFHLEVVNNKIYKGNRAVGFDFRIN